MQCRSGVYPVRGGNARVWSLLVSVTAAVATAGINRQHLHHLLRRYGEGGLDALEPRSRRPLTNPGRTPDAVRGRIVALRTRAHRPRLGAGPVTIAWHLDREGQRVPSTSTVRRILHAAGLVTPEPRKIPGARGSGSRPRHKNPGRWRGSQATG